MSQSKVRKNPMKRVVKEGKKVSDTKVESQYYFTDKFLNVAFDTKKDNHHKKILNHEEQKLQNLRKLGLIYVKSIG